MIDPRDPGTQQLQLEQKRGRGRPATGKALSNAERQRRYREAQKAQRNENMHKEVAEDLRAELAKTLEEIEGLKAKLRAEFTLGEKARSENKNLALKVAQLETQLKQRNEKPAKARKHRDDAPLQTILDAHNLMEERRKSGELNETDALWRFIGATLQVIEQHGLKDPK